VAERIVALTALGKDRPGLVADISGAVTELGGNIVHVEQSAIYGLFSMVMLIEVENLPPGLDLYRFAYELSLAGRAAGVDVTAEVVERDRIERAKDVRVVTIVGSDKPGVMNAITRAIADARANIERMHHVAQGDLMAFEIWVDVRGADFESLRHKIREAAEGIGVSAVIQPHSMFRTRKRLVVFDMDSTIIEGEAIDALAKAAGVEQQVSDLTARAMRGELDFSRALHARVQMLKGLPVKELERIADELQLTPGSADLVTTLKRMGFRVALISGGFTFFTDKLKRDLGFDYTFANELVIKGGRLTGEVKEPVIDARRKAAIVRQLMKKEGLGPDEVVAVGDGANDRIMVANAGLGIAFNAKDVLKRVADGSITHENLRGLLYALGATDRDIAEVGPSKTRKTKVSRERK
jgi:phosphoserine phosphatase